MADSDIRAMKAARKCCSTILLLGCLRSFAAGAEYYQRFLAVRGTNVLLNQWITLPSLLDTNNATPKLTNLCGRHGRDASCFRMNPAFRCQQQDVPFSHESVSSV